MDNDGSLRSIAHVVGAYIREHRSRAAAELAFYRQQPTAQAAIRSAALAQTRDGKHSHQWRIPSPTLERFADRISLSAVRRSRTFDELHELVRVARVHGIGELAIYDTAHRIGAHLGLSPERVYLHRGTRKGAAALGLSHGHKTIEVRELPRPFRRLRPYEIEDCLCIYERELRQAWLRHHE